MPNDLTGDFDVVAEFAITAANRVLAAMHRIQRFPHSLAIRVDDSPPPDPKVNQPSIVASVDTFGDPSVNHNLIGSRSDLLGQFSAADPLYLTLDPLVNAEVVGATVGPIVPSHLQGRAQLQLFPPSIEVADGSGTNVTVRLQMISRYFPDPYTSPVAEFVRGELRITAAVNQVASQVANVVDVDIKADTVSINFSPMWSSRPLSAEDVAGVNLLIRNALKTSFLPSNTTLPSNIQHMQFKTLLGAQSAIAVLLNMHGGRGNPASLNNVFLGSGDDFALAAGRDFMTAALSSVRDHRIHHFGVYEVSLGTPTLDLQNGRILFTIKGHAHTPKPYLPDFDFTVKQAFTLNPSATTPGGPLDTAELALLGDISLHTSSWAVNLIKGLLMDQIRDQRQDFLDQTQPAVRSMLSADRNLGGFLKSLLNPVHQKPGAPPPEDLKPVLTYTSVEIRPSGIVLHGSLAVTDWPAAHVEFEQIPTNSGGLGGVVVPSGPDYSALRSWIPGGTIQQYEWRSQGQTQPGFIDDNKFVLIHSPLAVSDDTPSTTAVPGAVSGGTLGTTVTTAVSGYVRLCLTVRGVRLSSSGPVVAQPVTATVCGYNSFPIINGLEVAPNGALPLVALAHPGPRGLVEVAGHASARPDGTGGGTPNRIVHFADETTASSLEFLLQAVRESKRQDAAAAVLAVLTPSLLAKTRYTEGVIYAEEQGDGWTRAFGVKTTRRPLTLIAGPRGDVLWQHEGELDSQTLGTALRRHLVSGSVRLRMLRLSVRIGQPAPNFLFELAPGKGLTLRKLAGRPTVLVFWKSSSKPSVEAVRDLQRSTEKAGGQRPIVLAINDGEASELAKKVAAENGLSATLATDPQRKISLAYGVNVWPTTVFIDARGVVRGIRYGRLAADLVESPFEQQLRQENRTERSGDD
jgi:peroxiredoxin